MNQPPQINEFWEDRRKKGVGKDTGGGIDPSFRGRVVEPKTLGSLWQI